MISSKIAKGIASTLIALSAFSSCATKTATTEIDMTESITETTSVPSETIYNSEDTITPIDVDLSFDEVASLVSNYYGFDLNSYNEDSSNISFDYGDNQISYIGDYNLLLTEETIPDYCGIVWYRPRESEYHQIRRFAVNDFSIDEFEDSSWAEADYIEKVEEDYSFEITETEMVELSDSSKLEGYFFIIGEPVMNSQMFYAIYYFGNYTITYSWSFNQQDYVSYRSYLDICEMLGLPTSDEATQVILG